MRERGFGCDRELGEAALEREVVAVHRVTVPESGDAVADPSTQPAMSEPSVRRAGARNPPMRAYSGEPRRHSQSLRLIDVAATLSNTCPAPGDGVGTSSIRNTSGDP